MRPISLRPRRSKFGAKSTTVDGIRFDSMKEARRYGELKLLLKAGTITGLKIHPTFDLWAGVMEHAQKTITDEIVLTVAPLVKAGTFTLDFQYFDIPTGRWIYEDVKGGKTTMTEAYQLRKRLLYANYGIVVREV